MSIQIAYATSNFEREPLIRPFGFKGGYTSELWQTVVLLRSQSGAEKIGLGTQNPLWSDARVAASFSEPAGNALMFAITDRALQILRGQTFVHPVSLLEELLPKLQQYGRSVTNTPDLRTTFLLNALVAVDNAVWLLYAQENGLGTFDDLIPETYHAALSFRNRVVVSVPLVSYSTPIEDVVKLVQDGYFLLKIKLGHPGDEKQMLEADMARLRAVHESIGHFETEHTESGKIPYYFDMNGRYPKRETLERLLDFAERIGALDQILIIEEPFPEELEIDVSDLPVRIAADESAHTDADALKRIELGYGAIALKPAAKTLSMTFKIAQVAHERGIPCFCADLTVNPILIDWNKNVAARLAPFPGLRGGLLETNGHQNYLNWDRLLDYHPCSGASWIWPRDGVFHLDDEFFRRSGGIFETPEHYRQLALSHTS